MKSLRKRERETLWPTECREVCASLQPTEIERDSLAPRDRERERERLSGPQR